MQSYLVYQHTPQNQDSSLFTRDKIHYFAIKDIQCISDNLPDRFYNIPIILTNSILTDLLVYHKKPLPIITPSQYMLNDLSTTYLDVQAAANIKPLRIKLFRHLETYLIKQHPTNKEKLITHD